MLHLALFLGTERVLLGVGELKMPMSLHKESFRVAFVRGRIRVGKKGWRIVVGKLIDYLRTNRLLKELFLGICLSSVLGLSSCILKLLVMREEAREF